MKNLKALVGLAAVFAVSGVFLLQASSAPKPKKVPETEPRREAIHRAAAVKHIMKGIMFPNCAGLEKALKADPADNKAWAQAEAQAACLNEASYLLMADGRCPDGTWAKAATQTLRSGSAEMLAAIRKKDLETARAALKRTTQACVACHVAHKM